jgi:hypothetical protein
MLRLQALQQDGLGKSFSVEEETLERGFTPQVFNSHASPLALYELFAASRQSRPWSWRT